MNYIAIPGLRKRQGGTYTPPIVSSGKETARHIMEVVSNHYEITIESLIGKSRRREIVLPRHVCFFLIYRMTTIPLGEMARMFGGRDHTTAIHGREAINNLLSTDENFRQEIELIKNKI